jgi:iron-sulfur cluster assembly protein
MATPTPRSKPQVMRLSNAAAERLKEIMGQSDHPVAGLRVGVEKGGCAGMSYTMEYAESAGPHDEIIEDKGVRVFIDPKAVLYLLGTEMDYQVDKFTAGFVFNNPNQTAACGCGHSVELAPAKV